MVSTLAPTPAPAAEPLAAHGLMVSTVICVNTGTGLFERVSVATFQTYERTNVRKHPFCWSHSLRNHVGFFYCYVWRRYWISVTQNQLLLTGKYFGLRSVSVFAVTQNINRIPLALHVSFEGISLENRLWYIRNWSYTAIFATHANLKWMTFSVQNDNHFYLGIRVFVRVSKQLDEIWNVS